MFTLICMYIENTVLYRRYINIEFPILIRFRNTLGNNGG